MYFLYIISTFFYINLNKFLKHFVYSFIIYLFIIYSSNVYPLTINTFIHLWPIYLFNYNSFIYLSINYLFI